MTASMSILCWLALIFANAPFITTKFFGIVALKRKHIGHQSIELLAGFLLTAILAYILESRAGAVHAQDWEFTRPLSASTRFLLSHALYGVTFGMREIESRI